MNPPQPMTNSHILVNGFDYYEPETVAEATALLAQHGGRAKVIAGGTDLLVQMKVERIAPQAVISLNRIPGLERTEVLEKSLRIGARASILSIERHPLIQTHYQALAEACANFSSTQVQTMGTIGGNLGNASPAADSAPSLLAFGATLTLAGPEGERTLPLADFFLGPGRSALQAGEIITAVTLPQPQPGTGSAFAKVSRVTNDIAKANCAVVLVRGAGNRIVDCRLAFGSVAPTPMRARQTEALLTGQVWSEALADAAAEAAAAEVTPIDDVRSTAAYRREVVRVMVSDGLRLAWERAGETGDGETGGQGDTASILSGAGEMGRQGDTASILSGAGETGRQGDAGSVLSGAGVGAPAQSKDAASTQDRSAPFDSGLSPSAQGASLTISRQAAPAQERQGDTASILSGAGGGAPAQSKDAASTQDRSAPFDSGLSPSAQGASLTILQQAASTQGAPHLAADEKRQIVLKVNGRPQRVWVSPNDLLLNVLRNDLELTGTKYGCGIGECSACTVLLDGKPVLSCLVLAVEAAGHEVITIEGLAKPDGTLDPLQEAFINYGAYQCGYCTPGQIITAKSLLLENPHPTEDDVRHHLRGNMCRCTGYAAIARAVLAAAESE